MKKRRATPKAIKTVTLKPATVDFNQARVVKARAYAERTHEEFLLNLQKAEKLGEAALGALAGPVKTTS